MGQGGWAACLWCPGEPAWLSQDSCLLRSRPQGRAPLGPLATKCQVGETTRESFLKEAECWDQGLMPAFSPRDLGELLPRPGHCSPWNLPPLSGSHSWLDSAVL